MRLKKIHNLEFISATETKMFFFKYLQANAQIRKRLETVM